MRLYSRDCGLSNVAFDPIDRFTASCFYGIVSLLGVALPLVLSQGLFVPGLSRLTRDLGRREWQAAVRGQVRDALLAVLQATSVQVQFEVLLVWNNTNR